MTSQLEDVLVDGLDTLLDGLQLIELGFLLLDDRPKGIKLLKEMGVEHLDVHIIGLVATLVLLDLFDLFLNLLEEGVIIGLLLEFLLGLHLLLHLHLHQVGVIGLR